MIDDAAQSFGAKLNQQMVGTFGEAGFFSFSPGKPTAGHMGSFFWSSTNIVVKKRQNRMYHYLKWKDFELNRLKIYDDIPYRKLFNYIFRIYNRVSDTYHDDISFFENEILGGIFYDLLNENFSYRKQYLKVFKKRVHDNQIFRVLDHIRGEASPHKIVLIFHKEDLLEKFQEYLLKWNIFSMKGYRMLSSDLRYLENAKFVENKILEIPIEDDSEKMEYLIEKVELFVKH